MKIEKIEQLVIKTQIGNCVINIEKVTGGLSHRMYKVTTDKGVYAIKELNQGVMKKKEAYSNFVFSEKVVEISRRNKIPAVGALKINNKIITKIDNDYFMIFKWLEGKILKAEEITEKHCETIGEILSQIHNTDFSEIEDEERKNLDLEEFEWNKYIKLAEKQNKAYTGILKQNMDLVYKLNKDSSKALKYARNNLIISHTDLDRKNVIWQEDKPFVIDWEASGYINPTIELIQVAWYWSGGDIEKIQYNKFEKVINTYRKYYKGDIDQNVDILIYADNYAGLAWLDYNLRRSLCIENNYEKDVIELAENEVIQSIKELIYNVSQFKKMLEILKKQY